jgi:cytochrome c551/c552
MKIKIWSAGIVILLFLTFQAQANPPIEDGKSIFMARCAACHNINKAMTGPALSGISERRNIDWLVKFIQSSQTMIKSGDADAVTVFEKFNKVPMPDHPDLTEENIKSIVEYIKAESKPVEEEKAPFAKPGKKKTLYTPIRLDNYAFLFGFLAVVIALISSLYYAVQFKTFQRNKQNESKSA